MIACYLDYVRRVPRHYYLVYALSELEDLSNPILALHRCLPEPSDGTPTTFSVFVRLSLKGRAQEVVTELDAALGKCMTDATRETRFPTPPREDYWVQVNMAAPL